MPSVLVFGCGGHGKVVADALQSSGVTVSAFVDDAPPAATILGIPVIPSAKLNVLSAPETQIALGVGDNALRRKILDRMERMGFEIVTVIHPASSVSPHAIIGTGTVVCANAVVGVAATLGRGCVVNTGATIDHDCVLGDCVQVCPGGNLAGRVHCEDEVFIGTGAVICPNLRVGRRANIGAGGVVIRDVPPLAKCVGNPVRVLRQN